MSDIEKDKLIQAMPYDPALFHNDEKLYLIYKKLEGICGAVFLVTNLVPDTEILKKTLREQSLFCLDLMVEIVSGMRVNMADLQRLSARVSHIHSIIDISFWSGIISQMNSSLIQREINTTSKMINDILSKGKSSLVLESSFFNSGLVKEESFSVSNSDSRGIKDTKGHAKRQNIKDNKNVFYSTPIPNNAPSANKHSERRDSILKLLKDRSNLSVKDFLEVISDFSEKTIQRELLSLVAEGKVRKEGERRWSTYSLAQ